MLYVPRLQTTLTRRTFVVNVTESIPLNQSWTNATVSFKSIERTAPITKSEALWVDSSTQTLFSWGGEGPYGKTSGADNITLWALRADQQGGGSWAPSVPDNPAVFDTLYRGTAGSATTCNGIGYLLGGLASPASDENVSGGLLPLPGLLTYNMTSATWTNLSATFPEATVQSGEAQCLPFGPNGLVMFLGGMYSSVTDGYTLSPISLNNLTFYDPITNEWFSQMAGGDSTDVPDDRDFFCSVGAAGLNGTFEMYAL